MSELGQKIIAEVRKVAAEHPDYIYQKIDGVSHGSCLYIYNNKPSCIIGHALWNVGLIDANWKGDTRAISDIRSIIGCEGWPLDSSEINWLAAVQHSQDRGTTWSGSVRAADEGKWFDEDV